MYKFATWGRYSMELSQQTKAMRKTWVKLVLIARKASGAIIHIVHTQRGYAQDQATFTHSFTSHLSNPWTQFIHSYMESFTSVSRAFYPLSTTPMITITTYKYI